MTSRRFPILLLLITIASTAAAQPTTGSYPAILRARLDASLAAATWDSALAPAEELASLAQTDYLETLYTVLRIRCAQGDKRHAYETLETLLDAGWWDHRRLRNDTDLALINQEERCRDMVRQAWSRQYIRMLERDSRDEMQKPAEIMAALEIRPGERVADIGAGSGYFTLRLAEAVGDGGRVLALDIRQEMLDYIAERLRKAQLGNVDLKLVPSDDPQLPPGGLDTILMVDTIHYVKDRVDYAKKLRAGLAPGGRVVVIDFRYDPDATREFAPPIEQQVPREELDAEMAAAGLRVVASHDFLPEQYFVVYAAP